MSGTEVKLTRAQAGKVYDRAFAGREHELHEGHPSWAAFQRFVKAGWGPRQATPSEAQAANAVEPEPVPDPELEAFAAEHGISLHEAKLVQEARRRPSRVQGGPEGTIQGQDIDTRRLEDMHHQARGAGYAGGSY